VIRELRHRSKGRRESGAFLFGRKGEKSPRITAYRCYDDLDPDAYRGGAIEFHAAGYAALWQHCRQKQLRIIADAHTHPGGNVNQSPIDRRNPMIPSVGHTAIIVPNFGRTPWWSLDEIGVHEYLGNFKWRTYRSSALPPRIKLALW
ncbi:MAG: hypothetical protein ACREML_14330, partial [Vulcanimicrobiaceae bacterium]